MIEDCGHDNPAVRRIFDAGDGDRTIWKICENCMKKECYCDFMIKELKN